MAYEITKSNGLTLVTLLDGELDDTSSDLVLLGKNYLGYGEIIAENFIHLIENLAGKTRTDLTPLEGQIWYNNRTDEVAVGFDPEELYFNIDGKNTVNSWKHIVSFTSGTGIEECLIVDTSNAIHRCIRIKIKPYQTNAQSVLVAIISVDDDFTPAAANLQPDGYDYGPFLGNPEPNAVESVFNGKIGKGINLNNSSAFKLRGVAVEAEFADVAEIYESDASYEPGTLVSLGGVAEVTQTTGLADTNIFGIVSTRPAYLMNTKARGKKNALPIAVAGRIPVKVKGVVKRGDRLIASDEPGIAQAYTGNEPVWSIVGRSLNDYSGSGVGKVEATIGVR
jgi:hypothetical protein